MTDTTDHNVREANTPRSPKLSLGEIDHCIGTRQAQLTRLLEERDRDQRELCTAREQLQSLAARIRQLETNVTEKNQQLFVLQPELQSLHGLKKRVHQRGTDLARSLKGESSVGNDLDKGNASVVEQRVHTRKPVQVEVTLGSESNFFLGFSENVSDGGLFVATHDGIRPIGERFPLTFTLPGHIEPIFCLVEVAWVREYREDATPRDGSPGMGVRFVGLSLEDQQTISEFVGNRQPLFFPEPDDLC